MNKKKNNLNNTEEDKLKIELYPENCHHCSEIITENTTVLENNKSHQVLHSQEDFNTELTTALNELISDLSNKYTVSENEIITQLKKNIQTLKTSKSESNKSKAIINIYLMIMSLVGLILAILYFIYNDDSLKVPYQ